MLMTVTRIAGKVTIKFFEDDEIVVILEEEKLAENLISISVFSSSGICQGQLLFYAHEQPNLHFYNLALVLSWIKKCQVHLRITL